MNKKIVGIVVGLVTFLISYFVVQQFLFKPASFDKEMMKVANELNKSCPIMVDKETRLDNAMALPDNVFQYNYTLVNLTLAEIHPDTLRKFIEPGIINTVRTNPDLKIFRDNKTTMAYNYKDKVGEFIAKIEVTPNKYLGK